VRAHFLGFSRVIVCVAVGCSSGSASVSPVDASTDTSDARRAPKPGDPCSTRADCDDGVFCDGVEECLGGVCLSARNAACRDPGGCATASCDEAGGGCSFDPSGACESAICRVDVGCSKPEGCAADAECDDGRSCTDDRCDAGACVHLPVDARCPSIGACGIGVCLGEEVADAIGCGARPDAAKCAPGEGCAPSFACAPLPGSCVADEECSDGSLCDGVERCIDGKCVHGERTTCLARDACHHARCKTRSLGDPYCKEVKLPRCP
jgi:hypothetical protein